MADNPSSLIAILLGRLRMTTQEALGAYNEFAKKIFSKTTKPLAHKLHTYGSSRFEKLIKTLVSQRSSGSLMRSPGAEDVPKGPAHGRSFVCAVNVMDQAAPQLFRSYPSKDPKDGPDREIWEAARATTAAPTYFPPMTIKDDERGEPSRKKAPSDTYVDGALRYNNPSKYMLREARDLFGEQRRLGCLLSIGTGKVDTIQFPQPRGLKKLIPMNVTALIPLLKSLTTDCESTHAELEDRFSDFPSAYFRFNLPGAAKEIGLDEFRRMDELSEYTLTYLRGEAVSQRIDDLVRILSDNIPPGLTLGDSCGLAGRGLGLLKKDGLQTKTRGRSSDNFTGRQPILEKLNVFFEKREVLGPRRQYLLYGVGGAGKTEIALKVSEVFEDRFKRIYWIDGRNQQTIEESIQSVVEYALPESQGDSSQAFVQWLSNLDEDWLLVFDDCCDQDISAFIPPGDKGNILYTSRHREMKPKIHPKFTEQVGELDETDAAVLLLRAANLDDEASMEHAGPIAKVLGYLPLAIEQAGAYIAASNCYIDQFLERYEEHRQSLFRKPKAHESPPGNLAVYATFDLSYQLIKEKSLEPEDNPKYRSALEILNLFCFFHNEGLMAETIRRAAESGYNRSLLIKEYLVDRYFDGDEAVPQELQTLRANKTWDPKLFDEGIAVLLSFSLVKPSERRGNYSIHSLIFNWAKDRMDDVQRNFYLFTARTLLFDSITRTSGPEELRYRRRCLPHIEALLANNDENTGHVDIFPAAVLHCADEADKYALALAESRKSPHIVEFMRRKTTNIRASVYGPNAKETQTGMIRLAKTLSSGERYVEAENLLLQVRKAREEQLGPDDISTCRVKRILAEHYVKHRQYDEAEYLIRDIAGRVEATSGTRSHEYLQILRTHYEIYERTGREAEAGELAERLVQIASDLYTAEDESRSRYLLILAKVRHREGAYEDSEHLFTEAYELTRSKYGDDSVVTLMSKVRLGFFLIMQDKADKAVDMCEGAYKELNKALGQKNEITRAALVHLIYSYLTLNRFEEAEPLLVERVKVERELGEPDETNEKVLASISRMLDRTVRKGLKYEDYASLKVLGKMPVGPRPVVQGGTEIVDAALSEDVIPEAESSRAREMLGRS